jgi:hypothetical protein
MRESKLSYTAVVTWFRRMNRTLMVWEGRLIWPGAISQGLTGLAFAAFVLYRTRDRFTGWSWAPLSVALVWGIWAGWRTAGHVKLRWGENEGSLLATHDYKRWTLNMVRVFLVIFLIRTVLVYARRSWPAEANYVQNLLILIFPGWMMGHALSLAVRARQMQGTMRLPLEGREMTTRDVGGKEAG